MNNEYNKLRKNYDLIRKEVASKNKDLQKLDAELLEIKNARKKMIKNYQASYVEEQASAAAAYKIKILDPIEKSIAAAEDQLLTYKNDYEKDLSEITEENFLARCSTQQSILDDVKNASSLLQQRFETALGKDFYSKLVNHLSINRIKLQQSDLDRVITYFNRCEKSLLKMSDKPDRIGTVISSADSVLKDLNGSVLSIDKKLIGVIAIAILFLFSLAYKYVFPFYVFLLSFVFMYNVYRSYLIYKIMIVHKAVEDNIQDIQNLLHAQVRDDVEVKRNETKMYYEQRIAEAEATVKRYKKQLTDSSVVAENSFKFDDSSIRAVYDSSVKRQEAKEQGLLQMKKQLKNESAALTKQLDEIKGRLDTMIDDMKNAYINFDQVGTSVLFQPEMLFDIDLRKSKPIFFTHPEKSCLILYDDRMDAVNFTRLLCVQIRASMSPKCYAMTYYDDKTLGRDCLSFVPESKVKGDAVLQLFQLKTTANDLKETVLNYTMEMRKRQKDLREDRSIKKYNRHMMELKSITLQYLFGFWLDVPSSIISLPEMTLLLRTAGDYGIFLHLFMHVSDLYDTGKKAKDFVESVDRVYLLQNGECLERAKDFVIDNMLKKQ